MDQRKQRQYGFTLMEAIVALLLIATTGMALFSLINSNIKTLNRVQETNAENSAKVNALEYMYSVNPMIKPQGEVDFGSFRISWKAEITSEPRDGAGYPSGLSLYQLALYQNKITIQKPDGRFWFAFDLRQLGYKKVREQLLSQ